MARRALVVFLPLVLALAACNRPFREAVARAEASAAAGDVHGAALAWRDACRLDPGDTRACDRAEATAGAFVRAATATATAACAEGDADRCNAAIRPAFDFAPENPGVIRLLDESGRLHAARCPDGSARDPQAALARLSCLEAWREAAPTPAYRGRLAGERRALADELVRRAGTDGFRERPAAVHALLSSAACLDPARRAAAAEADRGFRPPGVPLEVVVHAERGSAPVPSAARLCADARTASAALACDGPGEPLRLEVELALSAPRYSMEETERTAERRVGTRQVPNPAWAPAADRVRFAEERLLSAEEEERRARYRCDEARRRSIGGSVSLGSEPECRSADDAAHDRMRLESEASSARSALAGIPPTLPEDVYRTVPYRERLHRWTAAFSARIAGPGGAFEPVTPPDAVLVHEDLERIAIPDLGVAGDPFEDLPADRFEELAAEALRAPLAERAGAALRSLAAAREAECAREGSPWSDGWLACQAEVAHLTGLRVEAALLRAPDGSAPIGCR